MPEITIASKKANYYSERGKQIHAICGLFSKLEKISQKQLIELSSNWVNEKILKHRHYILKDSAELSRSKKEGTSLSSKRVDEILVALKKMLRHRGKKLDGVPEVSARGGMKVSYTNTKQNIVEVQFENFNATVLKKNGIADILDNEPLNRIENYISDAHELRILQSCLYSWDGGDNHSSWSTMIKNALDHGKLRKIKFLLAQPWSNAARERAHTIGEYDTDPLLNFNNRTMGIIGRINNLASEYNKKEEGKKYEIEVRLFYRPNAVPIYQCMDEHGKNIITFLGIFWQHLSSLKAPHFQIEGKRGKLVKNINSHFNFIWKDTYNENLSTINWQKYIGQEKVVQLSSVTSQKQYYRQLEKLYHLRPFSIYSKDQPQWIPFKCFYHNPRQDFSDFLLEIDPERGTARIRYTNNDNIYYGMATKLHDSYSIYLHTSVTNQQDRIVYLNIYIGAGDLYNKDSYLAVYNNNNDITGFPYAQVMILQRIEKVEKKEEEEREFKQHKFKFDSYLPTLKEKKIELEEELSNFSESKSRSVGDYTYRFEDKNRSHFYQRLKEEIDQATQEIYFLGHGPNHFPNATNSFMDQYFKSHYNLLKEKKVKIYRMLLNKVVDQRFIDSVVKIIEDKDSSKRYELYISNHHIPIVSDLVLIDPEKERRTAILTYAKASKSKNGLKYPIKMEIIRKDRALIEDLHETCISYKNSSKLMSRIVNVDDIKRFLEKSLY